MITLEEFSELTLLIAEAGLDFALWPRVLERLSDALGGSATALGRQNVVTHDGSLITVRADPIFDRLYAEHYAARCMLWTHYGIQPAETCLTDRQAVPKEMFSRTEFYNDFWLPQDVHSCLTAFVLSERNWGACIGIGRSPRHGEWEEEHLALMRHLAPHLHRAAQVNLRLGQARIAEANAAEALDKLSHGVVVASGDARALFVNQTASQILAEADGLRCGASGLHADKPSENAELRKLIADVVAGGVAGAAGGMVTVSRPSGRRSLVILVAPFRVAEGSWFLGAKRSGALLFVADPERSPAVPESYLRRRYGLTRAEAAVAARIVRGEGLQAVADHLHVSLPTARTHLQRVFEKTQTRRQAELTRVVAESVAGLSLDKLAI